MPFSIFQMYTKTLIHLDLTARIMPDAAPALCHCLLPDRWFSSSSMLVEALCSALEIDEDKLRMDVKRVLYEAHMDVSKVMDSWLLATNTSCAQYMMKVVNCKSAVDGLFLWLSAVSQSCHINLLHTGGLWTTRESETVMITDLTIVYILRCFLSTPAMHLSTPDKNASTDSEYVAPFFNPLETEKAYITIPQVLNNPVHDMISRLDKVGLTSISTVKPLQCLLADSLQCPVDTFCTMMVNWLGQVSSSVPMVEKWLAVWGLTLVDYLQHLQGKGTSDGLELWAFSLATDKPVTVVQESLVWSTSLQGADFQQLTVLMTTYNAGCLCHLEEEDVPVSDPPQFGTAATQEINCSWGKTSDFSTGAP